MKNCTSAKVQSIAAEADKTDSTEDDIPSDDSGD